MNLLIGFYTLHFRPDDDGEEEEEEKRGKKKENDEPADEYEEKNGDWIYTGNDLTPDSVVFLYLHVAENVVLVSLSWSWD